VSVSLNATLIFTLKAACQVELVVAHYAERKETSTTAGAILMHQMGAQQQDAGHKLTTHRGCRIIGLWVDLSQDLGQDKR